MALLDNQQLLFDRQRVGAVTVGAADLPSQNAGGAWNPGDFIFNLSGSPGLPWGWTCSASTPTSITWQPIAVIATNVSRSVAAATTVVPGDDYIVVTAPAAITLPLASTMPAFNDVQIINASGGSVTVTPTGGTIAGAAALTTANNTGYIVVPSTTSLWFTAVGAS